MECNTNKLETRQYHGITDMNIFQKSKQKYGHLSKKLAGMWASFKKNIQQTKDTKCCISNISYLVTSHIAKRKGNITKGSDQDNTSQQEQSANMFSEI